MLDCTCSTCPNSYRLPSGLYCRYGIECGTNSATFGCVYHPNWPRIVAMAVEAEKLDAALAGKSLAEHTPRNADLLKIADRSPVPQDWYDE